MGKLVVIICVIVLAAISAVVFPKDKNDDKVVSSKDLHEKLNEERKAEGKYSIPAINSGQTSTNTYARKDKSWSSVPDFFYKMIKGKDKK